MKLVTYNIRFGLGADQKIDLERITDTVKNADIIALQEVERYWQRSGMTDQPEIISKHLKNYYRVFSRPLMWMQVRPTATARW